MTPRDVRSAMPEDCAAGYYYYRLAFDAEVIERLEPDAKFCVVTDEGTYVMTKRQFYETFSDVVRTASYQRDRFYRYSTTPQKAKRYIVPAVDT